MGLVAGELPEELLGDVGDQLRLRGADHQRHRVVRRLAIAVAHRPDRVHLGGIAVRDGEPAQPAVGVHHVDGAPVGQPRDGELSDGGQRRPIVQRRRQHLAHVGQEADLFARGLGVAARLALGLPEPCALERLGAEPRERQNEVAIFGGEPAVVLELKLDRADRAALRDEGNGYGGATSEPRGRRRGKPGPPFGRGLDEHGMARPQGLGERAVRIIGDARVPGTPRRRAPLAIVSGEHH